MRWVLAHWPDAAAVSRNASVIDTGLETAGRYIEAFDAVTNVSDTAGFCPSLQDFSSKVWFDAAFHRRLSSLFHYLPCTSRAARRCISRSCTVVTLPLTASQCVPMPSHSPRSISKATEAAAFFQKLLSPAAMGRARRLLANMTRQIAAAESRLLLTRYFAAADSPPPATVSSAAAAAAAGNTTSAVGMLDEVASCETASCYKGQLEIFDRHFVEFSAAAFGSFVRSNDAPLELPEPQSRSGLSRHLVRANTIGPRFSIVFRPLSPSSLAAGLRILPHTVPRYLGCCTRSWRWAL